MARTVSPSVVSPGKSPFHVRGSTYVGVRDYIDKHVPGGFAAVIEFLPDDDHIAFASQVFLPVSYYDVLPLIPLTEATALAENLPLATSVRQRARTIAQRDISGLYKLYFKAVSPTTAAESLQKAAMRYFDFGEVHLIDKKPNRSMLEHRGLPQPLLPWYLPMIEGYSTYILEIAGAHHPLVRTHTPCKDGNREGIDTASVQFEMSWSR